MTLIRNLRGALAWALTDLATALQRAAGRLDPDVLVDADELFELGHRVGVRAGGPRRLSPASCPGCGTASPRR